MKHVTIPFTPFPDVAAILHILLDVYERRNGASRYAIRVKLDDAASTLPGYYNQTDPIPRTTTNEQLAELEKRRLISLDWQPGQKGHLLDTVTLEPEQAEPLYTLLKREPLAERRVQPGLDYFSGVLRRGDPLA